MNCPHCGTSLDEHGASDCLDLWILESVFGWEKSTESYKGDFYPEGSYFVMWISPDNLYIVTQAFDKDGNNLRASKENPLGLWYEFVEYGKSYQYSTSIEAAWEIIEKLAEDNWIVSVAWGNGRDGRKYASIQMSIDLFLKADLLNRPATQMDAKALTVPLAICRAGLMVYDEQD